MYPHREAVDIFEYMANKKLSFISPVHHPPLTNLAGRGTPEFFGILSLRPSLRVRMTARAFTRSSKNTYSAFFSVAGFAAGGISRYLSYQSNHR